MRRPPRGRRRTVALAAGSLALVTAAVGAATAGAGPSVLPVDACTSSSGVAGSTGPLWVPTELAGSVPASEAKRFEYYSVGPETLLGPRGWSCSQLYAADGSSQMAVFPPGSADPTSGDTPPAAGAQVIDATFDYTGHGPGLDLVCPYFSWVASADEPCPSSVPAGEKVAQRTPDVVAITDPSGVKGALDGSGGRHEVTGLMIVPHAPDVLGGVNVAEISCSLETTSLCPAVLSDFVVRQFPVPTTPTS